jgi:hypothetical protein
VSIPPDTRGTGQSGHLGDHNAISDVLSAQAAQIALLQGALAFSVIGSNVQAASYVLAGTDLGLAVEISSASSSTVTIPVSGSVPFPVGAVLWVVQIGAGQVAISGAGGVTVQSDGSLFHTAAQYAEVKLRQRLLNTWILTGGLA